MFPDYISALTFLHPDRKTNHVNVISVYGVTAGSNEMFWFSENGFYHPEMLDLKSTLNSHL